MRMCLNMKVIAALAAVGVGVLLLAPEAIGAALPLMLFAACPLSMMLMMRAMSGNRDDSCSTGGDQSQTSTMDEVAALRAEVQHLRTAQARRNATKDATQP